MDLILPYKTGDLAESKSFIEGYRGAWFRCKIDGIRVTDSGHVECYLEYVDYPGENKEWIRLFQKNPACSKQQSCDQIMVRPSFPQWHWKDQVPEQIPNNDVVETVYETWKVGDLVDWFSEGCYWSAKITKLLDEDMLQVELHKPPIGEGQRYKANRNDLRPTLDWSLTTGWTVPVSQAKGECWSVARVVHRKSTESETSDSEEETSPDDGDEDDNSGGDGGDSQDVQLDVTASNTSQKASGSAIPKPSSTAESMSSSLNAQDNSTLTSAADMELSSSSKSLAPSNSVQPAVTNGQPGNGIIEQDRGMVSSIKQENSVDVLLRQYEQKMAEVDRMNKEFMERVVTSSQPCNGIIKQEQGMGSSTTHEEAVDFILRQYERLAEVDRQNEVLAERMQSVDHKAARLRIFPRASDDASAKKK